MSDTPSAVGDMERTLGALQRAEQRDFDGVMRIFGPASVWDLTRWGLGHHAGRPAIRRFLQDWVGGMEEYTVELEEVTDMGGGVVFIRAVQRAKPSGSRARLLLHYAIVFIWVGDLVASIVDYQDIEEGRTAALAAAGRATASGTPGSPTAPADLSAGSSSRL
jgi:hypothetical protein